MQVTIDNESDTAIIVVDREEYLGYVEREKRNVGEWFSYLSQHYSLLLEFTTVFSSFQNCPIVVVNKGVYPPSFDLDNVSIRVERGFEDLEILFVFLIRVSEGPLKYNLFKTRNIKFSSLS